MKLRYQQKLYQMKVQKDYFSCGQRKFGCIVHECDHQCHVLLSVWVRHCECTVMLFSCYFHIRLHLSLCVSELACYSVFLLCQLLFISYAATQIRSWTKSFYIWYLCENELLQKSGKAIRKKISWQSCSRERDCLPTC